MGQGLAIISLSGLNSQRSACLTSSGLELRYTPLYLEKKDFFLIVIETGKFKIKHQQPS